MNGIVRTTLRLSSMKGIVGLAAPVGSINQQLSRDLWNMCNPRNAAAPLALKKIQTPFDYSACGTRLAHSKAEKDLVDFLAEEIVAEKKAQKFKTIPTELEGFKVSLNGAEVTLERQDNNDTIRISFNVNHTVSTDQEPEISPESDQPNLGDMKSKPTFSVDIVRGDQTLGFVCSFNAEPGASGADDSYNDIFGIDEITLYRGEHTEKVYSVAGEIVDGYLYDLLMNYLEEKGISNEFAEKLVELSTSYEHTAYVSLLEGLAKFTSGK